MNQCRSWTKEDTGMIEKFGYDVKYDDGHLVEFLFWETNGRFYQKVRDNGEELKTIRISESTYISAYESYMNY